MVIERCLLMTTDPGDLVLEPFGGTCRVAVACEQIARYHPEDARRYVCVEQDEDGRDYIGVVLRSMGTISDDGDSVQPRLFGAK
jgi:hypothetical protein